MSRRSVHSLHRRQWVPTPLDATFQFFERPQNLPLITPPWLGLELLTAEPLVMARGLTIDYRVRVLGWPTRWRSLIDEWDPPHRFRDIQVRGPYRRWDHRHWFRAQAGGTLVEDVVVYELPAGALGVLVNRVVVRRQLDAIFDYRRARIAETHAISA